MNNKIKNFIKYNRFVYNIYFYIMSAVINFLKLFVVTDDRMILFNSFAGRKYDDSPKEIFELMKKDSRFNGYKFVWAFHNPNDFDVEGATKIKTDGFKYFYTALRARVWITNSSVERGLDFKGKHTFYLNTWHGTPIKLMGCDIAADNTSFSSKAKNKFDIMLSQGRFETNIFSRTFGIPKESFLEVGLPRNDILANYTKDNCDEVKRKLNIPIDKKVILYAPTFREYEKDETNGCVLAPPMNLKLWEKELGNEYILLFRAHYEVARVMSLEENDFARDMTNYPSLNELMICADILISDYSSIFFDYSITGKPMLHFTYDYDKYASLRGMYFDIRDYIDGGETEDILINMLKKYSCNKNIWMAKSFYFRSRYINFYSEATRKTVEYISTVLKL